MPFPIHTTRADGKLPAGERVESQLANIEVLDQLVMWSTKDGDVSTTEAVLTVRRRRAGARADGHHGQRRAPGASVASCRRALPICRDDDIE